MKHLSYLLSILVLFMFACGIMPSPVVVNTATRAPAATILPTETALPPAQTAEPATQIASLPTLQNSALVDFYDPARNPAADLQQAMAVARRENKRILLELGGDWCIWCTYMDEFYAANPELLQFRAEHYVLVKVNVSKENMNEEFLSQYPAAAGYPHIYILESDGTFLHSQDTAELEDGADSYVLEVFMAFLEQWALPDK